MERPENNKWLDEALTETIGSEKPQVDFEQWKKNHSHAVEMLTSRANSTLVSKRPLNIWNIIMKNPITKFAVAAVITAAIILGGHIFLGGGTSITIADVVEQMKKVIWMHAITEEIEYSKDSPEQVQQQYNSESWTSLNPYRHITVTSDGDIRYDGDSSGKYLDAQYDPQINKITIRYLKNDAIYNNMPSDPLQLFLMQFEEMEKRCAEVKYKKDDYEGTLAWYIDFDFTSEDSIHAEGTLVVNLETRLPIKFSTNTGDINNESIRRRMSTVIDYPDTGPTDIYLAGMPQDAVIEHVNNTVPTEFARAIEEFHTARENLPEKYALVTIFFDNDNVIRDVFLVYKDRHNKRLQHYTINGRGDLPQEHDNLESVIKWINGLDNMSYYIKIEDGEYSYAAYPGSNNEWFIRKDKLGSIRNIDLNGMGNEGDLPDLGWPLIAIDWPISAGSGHSYRIIQNDFSESNNLLCFERLNKSRYGDGKVYSIASKNLFYIDPQRDYICVRQEFYRHNIKFDQIPVNINELDIDPESIPTEPSSIIEVTEFGTTSAGQWYPQKLHKSFHVWYQESNGNSYSQQDEQSVLVYLKTNPVFPEGIFNPKNLP